MYQQGAVSPLLFGGKTGSRRVLLWEILTFQSPKMRFSAFWGLNLRTKERVFIQGNVGFNLSVTHYQFLQAISA